MTDTKRLGICAPIGFVAAGHAAGIKPNGKLDTAVIFSKTPCTVAGVFTSNKVQSAAVQVSRKHLSSGKAQAVVMTSGNANAATGEDGIITVQEMCAAVAKNLNIPTESVLAAQTGLIGIPLAREIAVKGSLLAAGLVSEDGGSNAAQAIMTTDTVPKIELEQIELDGEIITIGAMAKGAAMLSPAMATMLALLTTDANVSSSALQTILQKAMRPSFHSMVVDGCRSTNDTVLVLANGLAKNRIIENEQSPGYQELSVAITKVCTSLAMQMAQDAEGATKFMLVTVKNALSDDDAFKAAHTVVTSNLVKCSLYGEDAYWGRVLSEIGASGAECDQNKVTISYGGMVVCKNGIAAKHDTEEVANYMKTRDISIEVDLHLGDGKAQAFGCDLTHAYIDENSRTS